ncbi:MAG: histidinol-phosphate transaminase [Acidiferrobacterales bacterium]|nr:histidinol-phosphate transaminase [Acidiferrobacterales bacterium]
MKSHLDTQKLSESQSGVRPHAGLGRIKPHMVIESSADLPTIHIDISSNESVYGPSQSAISAVRKQSGSMYRYASDAVRELTAQIARTHGIDPDGIVCGHGSDDLLLRIAQSFLQPDDELICSVNGYQRIPNFAHTANAKPIRAADREFTADIDRIVECVNDRTRVVMLANPDNPSGTCLPGKEVRQLHARLPDNVLLVLDSAYLEYVDLPAFEDPKFLIEESGNVVMTRTFSKIHGLAGLRLGWMYAAPEVAVAVRKIGMTFPLSNVAYSAGMASLDDLSHSEFVYRQNRSVRTEFAGGLTQLELEVIPSQTNFVLVRFPHSSHTAQKAYEFLRSQGILARRLMSESFTEYLRFTLGTPEQMNEVLDTLELFFDRQRSRSETPDRCLSTSVRS